MIIAAVVNSCLTGGEVRSEDGELTNQLITQTKCSSPYNQYCIVLIFFFSHKFSRVGKISGIMEFSGNLDFRKKYGKFSLTKI